MRAILLSVVVVGLFGCPPEEVDDDTPPRVLAVEPAVPVVPVTSAFEVRFSEQINDATVSGDPLAANLSVVLVPRDAADDAFLGDFENPPLSESRLDDIVPVVVSVVRGDEAIGVAPEAPLAPRTAYRLIISGEVRDTAGNPLVDASGLKANFIWDFTTDAGAPAVDETDLPGGGSLVVPNRKRITVTFNQPVQNVTNETLRISGASAPVVDAILMDPERITATIILGTVGECERLQPSSTYTLTASDAIVADTGQTLQPFSEEFSTGPACDTSANSIVDVTPIAGEVDATLRFSSTKASTTEVRFGLNENDLDCLGGPCPVIGPFVSTSTGGANPTFLHSVQMTGLTLGVTYQFVAIAEDEVGFVARASGSFTTEVLPKVAINEFLADSPNSAGGDNLGEFIELASFEPTATHDLAGWTIHLFTSNNSEKTCTIPSGSIAPGAFVVIADDSFNGAIFGGVDEARVVRLSSLCQGLNNERIRFELHDPSGRPISTATPGLTPREGDSIERVGADAPDVEANFCQSPSGPTPGEANGAFLQGCG